MSLYRHPDAAIAAWLDDGPSEFSRDLATAVKATIRETRQRSVVVLPMPMLRRTSTARLLLVAALALALVAGLAFAAGMVPNVVQEPAESAEAPAVATHGASPAPTQAISTNPPAAGPSEPRIHGAGRSIGLRWDFPGAPTFDHGPVYPTFGGEGQQGYFFTFGGIRQYGDGATGARGIVIADVLGATVPLNNGVVLGEIDARTFMSRMDASARFLVGPVTPASFSGLGGFEADVRGARLERVANVDFSVPSRLIAVDAAGGIIAVQIWATSPGALAAWLPEARALLESTQLTEVPIVACFDAPRPIDIDEVEQAGTITLEGTPITVDYRLPRGFDFVAGGLPGVAGFEEPALERLTGLSYGFGAGLANSPRGLVIGEATRAKGHGLAGSEFASGAAGFVQGLDGVAGLRLENVRDGIGPDGRITKNAVVRHDPGPSWSHVDWIQGSEVGCLMDFSRPSRVSAVDVEGKRLVFQAWAAGDAELARWLPIAQTLIESMHVEVAP